MSWFRASHLPRVFTSLLALALFLTGTNYCLVGALGARGSTAMACHAMPSTDPAPSCSACGHAAPARSPSPAHTAPCCIVITTVVAPSAEKPTLTELDWAPLALATPVEVIPAPAARRALALNEQSPPADPASRAPLSSRAPPQS